MKYEEFKTAFYQFFSIALSKVLPNVQTTIINNDEKIDKINIKNLEFEGDVFIDKKYDVYLKILESNNPDWEHLKSINVYSEFVANQIGQQIIESTSNPINPFETLTKESVGLSLTSKTVIQNQNILTKNFRGDIVLCFVHEDKYRRLFVPETEAEKLKLNFDYLYDNALSNLEKNLFANDINYQSLEFIFGINTDNALSLLLFNQFWASVMFVDKEEELLIYAINQDTLVYTRANEPQAIMKLMLYKSDFSDTIFIYKNGQINQY